MIGEIFGFVKDTIKKVINVVKKTIFGTKKTTEKTTKTIEKEEHTIKHKIQEENEEQEQEEQEETRTTKKYFLVSSTIIDREKYKRRRGYIWDIEFKLSEEEFKNIGDLELYIYDKYLNNNAKKYYIKNLQVSEYEE